jgi:hypothetical protein
VHENPPLQWTGPASRVLVIYVSIGAVPAIQRRSVIRRRQRMKRTSTLSVFGTTYGVVLALTLLYAVVLCIYHGNFMYLRLWGSFLIVACIAAPAVLLFAFILASAMNAAAKD